MNRHHNTTEESGDVLSHYESHAKTQEDALLAFFHRFPKAGGWTPSEINKIVMMDCPITSVRRALSNLTRDQRLIKTDIKRMGPYGRREFAWKLPDPKQPKLI